MTWISDHIHGCHEMNYGLASITHLEPMKGISLSLCVSREESCDKLPVFPDRKLNDPRTGADVPGRETDSTAKRYEWRHETSMGRYVFY